MSCVPNTIEECFIELKKLLSEKQIEEFKNAKDLIDYHFGLGMFMRNKWGLWSIQGLGRWFYNNEIMHADDMSHVIIKAFWCHLNGVTMPLHELADRSEGSLKMSVELVAIFRAREQGGNDPQPLRL